MVPLPRFQLSLLLILLLTWSVQAGSPLRVGMLTDQPKAVLEQPQIMDGKVYDPPARTHMERNRPGLAGSGWATSSIFLILTSCSPA